MSKTVNRSDLIATIAATSGLKKSDAEAALKATLAAIQDAVASGNKVTLMGFGTFAVTHRAARAGRDPQTKKPIQIAASNSVRFKPGKALKASVN